jgi:hypothetical protein
MKEVLGWWVLVLLCFLLIVTLVFLHNQGVRNIDEALFILLPIVLSVLGWLGDHWFQLLALLVMARVWIVLEEGFDRVTGLLNGVERIEHKIDKAHLDIEKAVYGAAARIEWALEQTRPNG